MLVKYNGDPTEVSRGGGLSNTSTNVFGRVFRMGDVVDVSDLSPVFQKKLAGNPAFQVMESVAGDDGAEIIPPDAPNADAEDADETTAPSQRRRRRIS